MNLSQYRLFYVFVLELWFWSGVIRSTRLMRQLQFSDDKQLANNEIKIKYHDNSRAGKCYNFKTDFFFSLEVFLLFDVH